MKILDKVARRICEVSGIDPNKTTDGSYNWFMFVEQAQAAIDALGIIILPYDAEPMEGDLVYVTMSHIGVRGASAKECVTLDCEWEAFDMGHFEVESWKIIQRNGKPVIMEKKDDQ